MQKIGPPKSYTITPVIPTVAGVSFKKFVLENDMSKITAELLRGLNIQSFYEMDSALKIILRFPDKGSAISQGMLTDWEFLGKHFSSVEEFKKHAVFLASVNMYQQKFKMGEKAMYPTDVFQFNHGLSDCNQSVLKYIAGKTFIDGGAYVGDSAIMLQKLYDPGLVISFDPSIRNTARYKLNMLRNKIKALQFIIEHAALGEKDA